MTRRFLFLASFVVAMLAVAGCRRGERGGEARNAVEVDLDSIRRRGVLRAVTDYNSVNYFVHRGVTIGYQYELLSQYAKHLGVELEIVPDNTLRGGLDKLESGKADILASTLFADSVFLPDVSFCEPYGQSGIVLVRSVGSRQAAARTLREALGGDTVCVMAMSFYSRAMDDFRDSTGVDVVVRPIEHYDAEQLVGLVAEREIPQTLCVEAIAKANQWQYDSLLVGPALTSERDLAWGVRRNSPSLRESVSQWMRGFKRSALFKRIYRKYVIDPREHRNAGQSTKAGTYQPTYEALIRGVATDKRYDWRLVSSIVYQESRFNPEASSWAGAMGLMQLMPETAARFGVYDISDPEQNIRAGYDFLLWLDKRLVANVADPRERVKFVLAAYNVGLGHIMDAIRLAQKFGREPQVWEGNVETALLLKANPAYYSDPVVKFGFSRGTETVAYVHNVMERYANYKRVLKE